jgi:hypothetical protein
MVIDADHSGKAKAFHSHIELPILAEKTKQNRSSLRRPELAKNKQNHQLF